MPFTMYIVCSVVVGYMRSLAYNGKPNYNLDGACDRQQNSQKTKISDDLVITGTMKRQFKTNKFYLVYARCDYTNVGIHRRSCMLA